MITSEALWMPLLAQSIRILTCYSFSALTHGICSGLVVVLAVWLSVVLEKRLSSQHLVATVVVAFEAFLAVVLIRRRYHGSLNVRSARMTLFAENVVVVLLAVHLVSFGEILLVC